MAWAAVIAGGSALVGSYMNKKSADKAADAASAGSEVAEARLQRADDRLSAAMDRLQALTPPNLLQYIQPYQQAVAAGKITPEEAVFKMQEASAMEGVRVPEELLNAQRNALTKITQIADAGGLTSIDKARILDIQDQQAARTKGEQEAIIQNAQQRGVAGGGLEMQARLISQQQAANRAARAGTDVAAEAQKRALDAIAQQGSMATAQRTQAFNEQAKVAEAKDMISNFNTSFQNKTDAANVAARNTAQATNLQEAQRLQEFNISQREREAAARAAAAQNQWQNTFNQATNIANNAAGQAGAASTANAAAQSTSANLNAQAAAQRAAAIQGAASGIGSLASAYLDSQKKKNPDGTEG